MYIFFEITAKPRYFCILLIFKVNATVLIKKQNYLKLQQFFHIFCQYYINKRQIFAKYDKIKTHEKETRLSPKN